MAETQVHKEQPTITQKKLKDYFSTHDTKYLTEDAVFKNLATGQVHKGRTAIGAMLHHMYHEAFEAKLEVKDLIIHEDKAIMEGLFKGRHIGEFAGMPATNKKVNVPITVSYQLKNGLIKEAHIYMLTDVLMQQIGLVPGSSKQKTSYVVRDIFKLKFGKYREAKALLDEAFEKELMPAAAQNRLLTDFTGDAYRLIFEEGFDDLASYENMMKSSMKENEWQQWYEKFKPLVESGHREILKQIR